MHGSLSDAWFINHFGTENGIFQDSLVNTLATDALAPFVTRPSAAMLKIMQDKQDLVFQCCLSLKGLILLKIINDYVIVTQPETWLILLHQNGHMFFSVWILTFNKCNMNMVQHAQFEICWWFQIFVAIISLQNNVAIKDTF